jgi:C-5 cytosine-specific DNA methylase
VASASYAEVLDAAMAGCQANEIAQLVQTLSPEFRQRVLCALCALHSEIANNCREHAHQIKQLLAAECPLCINGESICPVREYAKEVARESL